VNFSISFCTQFQEPINYSIEKLIFILGLRIPESSKTKLQICVPCTFAQAETRSNFSGFKQQRKNVGLSASLSEFKVAK
jgi:hypothetical protein